MHTQTQSLAPTRGGERPAGQYGHFSPDGREYIITNPRTPRPWSNIIANERFGLAVAQSGSGFTWIDNSQLAVITRWNQDLNQDTSGKFLYVRDLDSGEVWSLSPAPMWREFDQYRCRHGLGYTTFETSLHGIDAEWTLFCHATEPIELWRVRLVNNSGRPRRLAVVGYLEWCCGVSPSPRREFHKLFIHTAFDAQRQCVVANNRMWDVSSSDYGHWNTTFPYSSAFGGTLPVDAAEGDQLGFLGRYGHLREPAALNGAEWAGKFGQHEDAIAALEILKDAWIDLVLADINMPVMDGEQMVLKMAEDGLLNTIPTIIVSTDGSRERAERLSAKGVRAFVRKPFTPESLRQAVHNVLGLE